MSLTEGISIIQKGEFCPGAGGPLGHFLARKEIQRMTIETNFWIICPCGCSRALQVEKSPFAKSIPDFGNKIWHHLVNAKGLEGVIQYLHNRVDGARRDQSA